MVCRTFLYCAGNYLPCSFFGFILCLGFYFLDHYGCFLFNLFSYIIKKNLLCFLRCKARHPLKLFFLLFIQFVDVFLVSFDIFVPAIQKFFLFFNRLYFPVKGFFFLNKPSFYPLLLIPSLPGFLFEFVPE